MGGPSASDNYAGVYEGRLQPGSRPALLIVDVVAAYLNDYNSACSTSSRSLSVMDKVRNP